MQRKILTGLIIAGVLFAGASFAQPTNKNRSEETVVIQGAEGPTTIEIKRGDIYINGEKIESAGNENGEAYKKIIIENNESDDAVGQRMMHHGNRDGQAGNHRFTANHAVLGVLTDAQDMEGGALISKVMPEAPAAKAGLEAGDRITAVDKFKVEDAQSLTTKIRMDYKPGDKVQLTYMRKGKTYNTEATLSGPSMAFQREEMAGNGAGNNAPMPDMQKQLFNDHQFPAMNEGARADRPKVGMEVEEHASGTGLTLLKVLPGSAAAKAGLVIGDVIMEIDGERMNSVFDLQETILGHNLGDKLKISYKRKGATATTELTIPRRQHRASL